MSLEVLLTVSKYFTFLSSFAFVGLLLALSVLTLNNDGYLSANSLALRRKASLIGLIWFFSSFTYNIATLADILGVRFTDALDMTTVRSFVTQVIIGQYLFAQTLVHFLPVT
jgi:putative copper resistance protein D